MLKRKRIEMGILIILGCINLASCGSSFENAPKVSFVLESENSGEVNENEIVEKEELSEKSWDLLEYLESENVVLSGYQTSNDYPYGYNMGKIEDEVVGKAILITPGTSIAVEESFGGGAVLYFEYALHQWVAEKSDGAILNISVEGNGIADNYSLNAEDLFQKGQISLAPYLGEKVHIVFSVGNEPGGNDECDWMVLKNVIVSDTALAQEKVFSEGGYVRSATYFGNEWPVNFWNSELDNLDQDLTQIRADGFDSIILVIPWREFQPQMAPVAYNEYAINNLESIMQAAGKNDLAVYARIGYTWDYYHDGEEYVLDRFSQILSEENVRDAWYSYVDKMHETLSKYPCFQEAFITWEDFWYILGICDENQQEVRQEKASLLGYQSWVAANYELLEYNKAFGTNYSDFTSIPIPHRTEPAMKALYSFYDDFLMELLEASQQRFPNLSMEVRMDWDLVYNPDGGIESYKHTKTFGCGKSNYTAVMYGIPMGFENVGERVGYQEAMEKTASILKQLKQQNDNKAVYIEQFIFADNTSGFEHNAQIKEEEMNAYLENVAPILLENSEGYGIWTYRNYCSNMLYNPQFALKDAGWKTNGNVSFEEYNGSMACYLSQNGVIEQSVYNTRNSSNSDEYFLVLDIVDLEQAGKLTISLGKSEQKVEISECGRVSLSLPRTTSLDIRIKSDDCIAGIDNVKLYGHVQQGFLYDENNEELICISGIRKLNEQLSK